jgi:hypothetical protein
MARLVRDDDVPDDAEDAAAQLVDYWRRRLSESREESLARWWADADRDEDERPASFEVARRRREVRGDGP